LPRFTVFFGLDDVVALVPDDDIFRRRGSISRAVSSAFSILILGCFSEIVAAILNRTAAAAGGRGDETAGGLAVGIAVGIAGVVSVRGEVVAILKRPWLSPGASGELLVVVVAIVCV
tara:strand:- start:462 stop:812 length:351 start_codon:yes stop_codon:yes gene_type:complete